MGADFAVVESAKAPGAERRRRAALNFILVYLAKRHNGCFAFGDMK
jgi:hypothetical protein